MNKKEIAQQFTRQMVEQNPASLSPEQVLLILKEIQSLCLKAQESSQQQYLNVRMLNTMIENNLKQVREVNKLLDLQTQKLLASTTSLLKTQKTYIWQRYWMAILMGVLSTLLTNLIWLFRT